MRKIRHHIDIETLMFVETIHDPAQRRKVLSYREFKSGGFFECGTSYAFFDVNRRGMAEMDLCHMIGNFWAFLAHARLFYKKMGIDAPVSVLLSIRNSRKTALRNHGNEALRPPPPLRVQVNPSCDKLVTHHPHIQFTRAFGPVDKMTDEAIAEAAAKAAKHICNAYGDANPNCYSKDGAFSWALCRHASGAMPWGAQS